MAIITLLRKLLFLSIISVGVIIIIYLFYQSIIRDTITTKQAGSICSKLIYENISPAFTITKVEAGRFFSLNKMKVSLYIIFANGKKTSSDCIFYKNYTQGIITLKQALLVDPDGKLIIFDNIKIQYN
ncbi:hypothetical protein ABSA28_00449 [Candidatus Hepatincolaceae symbiont of Richtersius coronifer]